MVFIWLAIDAQLFATRHRGRAVPALGFLQIAFARIGLVQHSIVHIALECGLYGVWINPEAICSQLHPIGQACLRYDGNVRLRRAGRGRSHR